MNIEEKLTASIISAINMLYGQEVPAKMVQLQKTKKEFEGHLTLVVFPFLKMSKKGPEQTAQEIGAYLCQNAPELISAYNAVKGFLNLTIASDCWIELLNSIHSRQEAQQDDDPGTDSQGTDRKEIAYRDVGLEDAVENRLGCPCQLPTIATDGTFM